MALDALAITKAISLLPIQGVNILDAKDIPNAVFNRDCPVLFPNPDGWLGGNAPDSETTFGTAKTRYWRVHRVYKYIFYYKALGTGRGISEYNDGVPLVDAIITALVQLDVDNVDVEDIAPGDFATYKEPSGALYRGLPITIKIIERINP